MERVSLVHGKNPILLIAPHGYDDSHTDILTEAAAKECAGSAVINRAWQRDKVVDIFNDKANCNNINHCRHDVVREEFLDPINTMFGRLEKKLPAPHATPNLHHVLIFHIHGCGNDIRKQVGRDISLVIGWGDGDPQRPTCSEWRKDRFAYMIQQQKTWIPGIAAKGSMFAAWDQSNLLQYWRTLYMAKRVQAMQLEFVTATRRTKAEAEKSGRLIGALIDTFYSSMNGAYTITAGWSPFLVKV